MKTVSYIWLFIPIPRENRLFLFLVNTWHADMGIVQDCLENSSVTEYDVLICHYVIFLNFDSELSTEFLWSSKGS